MTRVAVVIVSYNGGTLLSRCLSHLHSQTRKPDRLLVVDNASTEASTLQLLDTLQHTEVVRLNENLGYGAALNRAVAVLDDCDFVCCLNQDAFAHHRWIEALIEAAEANPGYGSFASLMLSDDDPDIVDGAGDVLHFTGIVWRRYHGEPISTLTLTTEPVFSACGGAVMYSLPAYRKMNGFDESFFMYIEDIDLGYRLQNANLPCLFVPDAVVRHIGSATTGYRSAFSIYYGHRNLIWNYFKNTPILLLLLTLPCHLLMTILSIAVFGARGELKVICRAKWDGFTRSWKYLRNKSMGTSFRTWRLLNKRLTR